MSANYDVMLVAGNLLLISDGVPGSWRDNVLESLLFSQLYASSQVGKFDKPEKWYTAHTRAMTQTKWSRTHYTSENIELDRHASITLQTLIQERLLGRLNRHQRVSVERMISRLEHLPCAEVVQAVFRENVISTVQTEVHSTGEPAVSTIALQLSLIEPGPIAYSAFVRFSTSEVVDADVSPQCFLGKNIVGSVSIDFSQQELDKVGYEKYNVRKKVLSSLPGTKDNLILAVPSECS